MEKFLKYGFLSLAFHSAVLCAVVSFAGGSVPVFLSELRQKFFFSGSQNEFSQSDELFSDTLNEEQLTAEKPPKNALSSFKNKKKALNPAVQNTPPKKTAKKQKIKTPSPAVKKTPPPAPLAKKAEAKKTAPKKKAPLIQAEGGLASAAADPLPKTSPLTNSSAKAEKSPQILEDSPVTAVDVEEAPQLSSPPSAQNSKSEENLPVPEYPDDLAKAEENLKEAENAPPLPSSEKEEEEKPPSIPKVVVVKESKNPSESNKETDSSKAKNSILSSSSSAKNYTSLLPVSGNPQPVYPESARQKKQQGSVSLLYFVDEGGLVDKIQLTRSSGHAELDNSALRALSRYKYQPGQEGWYKHRVDFQLKPEKISQNP